jgi:hypothetical protein
VDVTGLTEEVVRIELVELVVVSCAILAVALVGFARDLLEGFDETLTVVVEVIVALALVAVDRTHPVRLRSCCSILCNSL